MGGALSLAAAVELSGTSISAAAPIYGIPDDSYDLAQITVPVLMTFATQDFVYPPQVRSLL